MAFCNTILGQVRKIVPRYELKRLANQRDKIILQNKQECSINANMERNVCLFIDCSVNVSIKNRHIDIKEIFACCK